MELEIVPEPDPPQRHAIAEALSGDAEGSDDGRSDWWRRGVRENLEES